MIEKLLAGARLARRHLRNVRAERVHWRSRAALGVATAAITVALAIFQLPITPDFAVAFAPAALMLCALMFGALATGVATLVAAMAALFVEAISLDVVAQGVLALLCAGLVRSYVAPLAVTAIYVAGAVTAAWIANPAFPSWPWHLSASVTYIATTNFVAATAVWCVLPDRLRNYSGRQRRSVTQLVFWSSAAMAVLLVTIVAALANRAMTYSAASMVGAQHLLPIALCALGASRWLTHAVTSPLTQLARPELDLLSTGRRGAGLRATSCELASVILPRRRGVRRWRQRARRAESRLAKSQALVEKMRSALNGLTERLRVQSATLHELQRSGKRNLKELEQALQQANATIELIRKGRNLFIAMMSHEVRTPLHGLMSTLSLLREESLSAEGVRRLEIARASARSLLKIANDILDLSRIEAGSFSLETRPFDIRRLVGGVVEEFQAMAEHQCLTLAAETTEAVPATVLGDRDRIHQVVGNLVSNALKFTSYGGVRIRTDWRDDSLVLDVIDSGQGVPAEKRDVIFDSFVQAESANNRRFTGTGLGLTISRHLAEAMGGSLTLHSTGPHGSTFRLQLALEVSDEPALEEQSQRILAHPTGRVLVVEDNEANQYVAKVMLESLGCTADIVGSGAAALDAVGRERYDLILMDCQLPGMDGFETSQRLRQILRARIPIVAMTANALPEDKAKCAEADMDGFLAKPFTKAELSKTLEQWLGGGDGVAGGESQHSDHSDLALDSAVFDELYESLRWRMAPLREIYDAFTGNVEKALTLLSSPGEPSPVPVQRALHTVRGSAGMVGARRIARLAAALEQAARTDRLRRDSPEIAQLTAAMREFERELERRLSSSDRE